MAHLYKEPRECECGYTTRSRGNFSTHKRACPLINIDREVERDSEKDARIALLEKQLAEKEEQLRDQREEIKMFEKLMADMVIELKEEVKQLRKRKRSGKRVYRTEPERRAIAKRQNWLCAGKGCREAEEGQELEEYDIDHIIPLSRGGSDDVGNLQALCPGCHRKKTDQDRLLECT